jgi:hypothetical protein
MSKNHQATAPSTPQCRSRMSLIAVRTPDANEAGTVATARATLATRLCDPLAQRSSRRSKSAGRKAIASAITITEAPKMAGMTVTANGAEPLKMPRRNPTPKITSEPMKTRYSSARKAIIRHATSRRPIPDRRSAHAVSTTPPAPAVANRRVAATDAIVIW